MMKRATALALLAAGAALGSVQDPIRWINDIKQAQFEAKQTGRPMFVVFR
jgi:hypothetical protein